MGTSLFPQLQKAKHASASVSLLFHRQRIRVLHALACGLRKNVSSILRANVKDVTVFDEKNPMRDRLLLTPERIEGMAREVEGLIPLPDPLGKVFDRRRRHGMEFHRISVPFGVVGVIYESRPNVTTDVAAICIKSGNVVLLKGGEEAANSYRVLVRIIHNALRYCDIDTNAVQMIDPMKRELVTQLITAEGHVDLVIPRGSQRLIRFIRDTATVPVIETGAGVCHTFVDEYAKLGPAAEVVFNAKTQRPTVCNALDTVLLHRNIYKKFICLLAPLLEQKSVEIFADQRSYKELISVYPKHLVKKVQASDFGREFLSQRMSMKVVDSLEEAIDHITMYSSKHSEAILTDRQEHIRLFQQRVDAAVVYANASTRWSDGAQFGLGSEIGNSTQKMHARGPMGPAEVTTYKWIVTGQYTTRP